MKKIIIGVSGASGATLGLKFMAKILESKLATPYLVISKGAKNVLKHENNLDFDKIFNANLKGEKRAKSTKNAQIPQILESNPNLLKTFEILQKHRSNFEIFDDDRLDSPISSGSFRVCGMAIIPCSANTLAKIACGISDTLITRSALVSLKERRKLVLALREMPLDAIMLKNMLSLCESSAIIAPPILGYYANIATLEQMEDFLFGKWLDSLDIEHNFFARWGENRNIKNKTNNTANLKIKSKLNANLDSSQIVESSLESSIESSAKSNLKSNLKKPKIKRKNQQKR